MAYVKLDCGILESTIWCEDSDTKVVWITLLCKSDATGFVECSIPGLARISGVPLDSCRRAIEKFSRPDPDSRTPENDGKRIDIVEGGFWILNYMSYRDKRLTHAERQARYRAKIESENASIFCHQSDAVSTGSDERSTNVAQEERSKKKEVLIKEKTLSRTSSRRTQSTNMINGSDPMTLSEFVTWAGGSSQPHIRVISEWAETTKADCRTKGQWRVWMKRHMRPAKDIAEFTDEQVAGAFKRMREAMKTGKWLTQYSLETVLKFLTSAEA